MAVQVVTITEDMVRAHQQLIWCQHPSGRVTVGCHGYVPDDSADAVVTKTCDVAAWLLRHCGGCVLPVRAIFDESGLFCTWQPMREHWHFVAKEP